MNIRSLLIFAAAVGALAQQQPQRKLACGTCHTSQAQTQPGTPMANALVFPASDATLHSHPHMRKDVFGYTYTIETSGEQSVYTVSDGTNSRSAPLTWAFGVRTQTFVVEKDGAYFETLVSYFPDTDGLDITPGDTGLRPRNVDEAFGRPLLALEVQRCVACHTTGAIVNHTLDLASLHPGISCSRCHVGAEDHLQAISAGKLTAVPARLERASAEDTSNFCGQCHRRWEDVVTQHLFGPLNIRFQPYRLAKSKCYDGVDRRIGCTGCHDPHQNLVRGVAAYDAKCLACHSEGAKLSAGMIAAHPAARQMPICPVAKSNCVSCHMPKRPLPGGHADFTDHYIRVVKAGESYPE